MKNTLFLVFSITCTVPWLLVGQQPYETGRVLDSLMVSNDNSNTFALYLPSTFEQNTPHSVVFVFDPTARGAVGVAPFIGAAEKYGHIIACSNTSKNGPLEQNIEIANALFQHVLKTFPIKENEIYLAGFSGGSRLVATIAVLNNSFNGIIACGAGFPKNPLLTPSVQQFSYVGICGDEDMNYSEMSNNRALLEKLGFKSTFITFKGGHIWPPAKEIEKAFQWLNVKNNPSQNNISDFTLVSLQEIDHNQSVGDFLIMAENYERLIKSTSDPVPDSIQQAHDALLLSSHYKSELKDFKGAYKKEVKLNSKLYDRIYKDFENVDKASLSWWENEFKKLKENIKNGSKHEKKMALRVGFGIMAEAYSRTNPNLYASTASEIEFCKKIISIYNLNFN